MRLRSLSCTSLLILALAAGCARRPVMVAVTEPPAPCRTTVDAAGRPADHAVDWIAPEEPEHRASLRAWCGAVGPAVVIAAPVAGLTTTGAATERMAVVTWNVHVGGADLRRLVESLRRGDLTGGAPVAHVVLLLQEVFREGPLVPARAANRTAASSRIAAVPPSGVREDIVTSAHALGLALHYVPSMRNGREDGEPAEDRGNAILASLPLSDLAAIELPFDRQRRVAVAATVSVPSSSGNPQRLRLASSHLNASAGASRLWLFASGLRALQARSLARVLGGDGPAILGSDLNTWADGPREPAVATLRRVFPDTAPFPIQPTFRLGLMLDYLFFRLPDGWQAATRRVDDRFGSDHHPLLALVQID